MKTAHRPQTNRQAEQFNQTIAISLRYYLAKHQRDWNLHVKSFSYAYKTQVRRSTSSSLFSLFQSRYPPGSPFRHAKSATTNNSSTRNLQQVRRQIGARLDTFWAESGHAHTEEPSMIQAWHRTPVGVREAAWFQLGGYRLVNKLLLVAASGFPTNFLGCKKYGKLQNQTVRLYCLP